MPEETRRDTLKTIASVTASTVLLPFALAVQSRAEKVATGRAALEALEEKERSYLTSLGIDKPITKEYIENEQIAMCTAGSTTSSGTTTMVNGVPGDSQSDDSTVDCIQNEN